MKVISSSVLVTIEACFRIFRPTIRSAIVKRYSKFWRYLELLLLFSARLESTIPCFCIPDRIDAHCLIILVRYSLFCRSSVPVPSRSNHILSINHNKTRFSESRIAVCRTSLVYLHRYFCTTAPSLVRISVSFGRGRMLRSTRDSSIVTVPHSSIDPSDPSTRDSSSCLEFIFSLSSIPE